MTLNYETPPGYDQTLPPGVLLSAIRPLRMIFWGALLVILDFKLKANGFGCDILNDALGMLLICIAVFQLARLPISPRYASRMSFIKIIAILQFLAAIDEHFMYRDPVWLGLLRSLLGLAGLIATVLFCTAMHDLARHAALNQPADSWKITRLLFIIIYLLPMGFFYLAAIAASFGSAPMHINLGPEVLIILPIFLLPIIHFFISTSRLKRALESLATQPPL